MGRRSRSTDGRTGDERGERESERAKHSRYRPIGADCVAEG